LRRFLVETLESRDLLAADPIITEFMANNRDTLFDEDGAASDWIELHNRGDQSIDLAGWYLTDNAAALPAWQFPATSLDPGQYVIVFASGKDRVGTGPMGEHHSNFNLEQNGEYLALVMPDGQSVTSEYSVNGTDFPQQREGVSYGVVNQVLQETVLVEEGDVVHTLIPDANDNTNFGDSWRGGDETAFATAGGTANWIGGVSSVGYGTGTLVTAGLVQDLDAGTKNQIIGTLKDASPWSGFTAGVRSDGGAYHMSRPNNGDLFGNGATDTRDAYHVLIGRQAAGTGSQLAELFVDNLNAEAAITPNISASTDAGALTIGAERAGGGEHFDGDVARILIYDRTLSDQEMNDVGRFLDLQYGLNTSFAAGGGSGLGTNVEVEMAGVNSTAYMRAEFNVDDRTAFDLLKLTAQYDDGFVAYLNGVIVASANAPAALDFQSAATMSHDGSELVEFDVTAELAPGGALIDGTNILALHGLNASAVDDDFFILPELTASALSVDQVRYFTSPTPRAENVGGVSDFVGDTRFDFGRGFYDKSFVVNIATDTANAEIYYTVDGSAPTATNPTAVLFNAPIDVTGTTTLRAVAFLDGYEPTNVDTQTYVFVDDVINQVDMDPDIVSNATFSATIRDDLKSIPTVSLVLDNEDMFGPSGIYSNPSSRGSAWEREVSVEYFTADTQSEFQTNAGIRLHGADARNHNKKPFRPYFHEDYGDRRLNFPLFDGSPIS
jgi:hypothetical protein